MVWLIAIGLGLGFVALAVVAQRSPARRAAERRPAASAPPPVPVRQRAVALRGPATEPPPARADTVAAPPGDACVLAFEALGLASEAARLAASAGIDLAEFRTLCERGCPPELALDILA